MKAIAHLNEKCRPIETIEENKPYHQNDKRAENNSLDPANRLKDLGLNACHIYMDRGFPFKP
jgi:hypothetical protein